MIISRYFLFEYSRTGGRMVRGAGRRSHGHVTKKSGKLGANLVMLSALDMWHGYLMHLMA